MKVCVRFRVGRQTLHRLTQFTVERGKEDSMASNSHELPLVNDDASLGVAGIELRIKICVSFGRTIVVPAHS